MSDLTNVVPGTETTRRHFLKVTGGGLVVLLIAPRLAREHVIARAEAAEPLDDDPDPSQVSAWLAIDADGAVTVYTGKVEVGQGIRTSLAQEVAEELRVPLASIEMVMGDTAHTPFDLGTFGSRSTPQMGTQLRRAAATAREMLVAAAATRWRVPASSLTAGAGRVTHRASGRSAGYGELTAGNTLTGQVRLDVTLTPAAEWKVAGSAAPRVAARDLVTGTHRFTSDITRPGMLYGRVLRPASIGATLSGVDVSAARAVPQAVVVRDGDFVGVAAPSTGDADRALASVRATWTAAPGARVSSRDVYERLRSAPAAGARGGEEGGRGNSPFVKGDAAGALAGAPLRATHTYTVAYIAHVPLEPRAAVAEWSRDAKGEQLTVWTGTQRPFAVREELSRAFDLPVERVRVIVPDTGSAYGGKHTGECAVEAARIARAARRPVKLVWTREEEFRWAYFRPAGVIDVDAGATRDGTIVAWMFDNYNSGPAGIRPPYAIANQRVEFHAADAPLREGSYRGLAATANHFARESQVDELAHLAGMDPLAFRLRNIDDPRLAAVLQAAAERFRWGTPGTSGNGVGLACGFEKGGYVATCAEVAVERDGAEVRIVRAVTAFDCGAVVNPDGLRNQIAGALIQGIGGALFEEIDFADGVIGNAHLRQYRVPRFTDVPDIDVVLVDRKDQPSFGAGETPIMALAPAVGSAIFEITGSRPRSLPMARNGLPLARSAEGGD
ncbi:MAG TPA: molybdopterin cofactor-binding domain-containing protein [Gemmatimonadaceae bacterium]|nr:molybdopterin cofactor-binding domain-containing protein [Gemmatimonadaceae bacterium]